MAPRRLVLYALILVVVSAGVYILNGLPASILHTLKTKDIKDSYNRLDDSNAMHTALSPLRAESHDENEFYKYTRSIKFTVEEKRRSCHGRRFLVYTCKSVCGGWGDRQKGITTLFLLALLTNRTFVIDMPKPCPLSKFLLPHMYDWNMCADTVHGESAGNVYHTKLMDGPHLKKLNNLTSKEMDRYPVITVQANIIGTGFIREHNRSRIIMPWLSNLTDAELIGSIIGLLFKPSKTMHETLVKFIKDKVGSNKLACCHIRNGKNPSIPNDSALRDGAPNVTTVFEFLKTYDAHYKIFVASDSEEMRNRSRNYFNNYVSTDRKIVHVDKTKAGTSESCAGFFTVIFEQWILTKCDVLLLTRSNFGAMGAYMRGHSTNLFLFLKSKGNISNVNVTDVQKIYKFV